jgi:uncharacterized membrane protein YccF (DUF307 family)
VLEGQDLPIVSRHLNLVWILFGLLWMATGRMMAALIMAMTVIGLPWTRAAFTIAAYTLLPFAWAHVTLAGLALWPMGKMIVKA